MASWQYKHIHLRAARTEEKAAGVLGGVRPEVGPYPYQEIEEMLNRLGKEGWELVSMEPHWFLEQVDLGAAKEVTRAKAITGWHCTFKRQV